MCIFIDHIYIFKQYNMTGRALTIMRPTSVRTHTLSFDVNWDYKAGEKLSTSLIPPFEYPVSKWALQVVRVINTTGVQNYAGSLFSRAVLPVLLTRLPTELAALVPTTNVEDMLDFL